METLNNLLIQKNKHLEEYDDYLARGEIDEFCEYLDILENSITNHPDYLDKFGESTITIKLKPYVDRLSHAARTLLNWFRNTGTGINNKLRR